MSAERIARRRADLALAERREAIRVGGGFLVIAPGAFEAALKAAAQAGIDEERARHE